MSVFDKEFYMSNKDEENNIGKKFYLFERYFNEKFNALQRAETIPFLYRLLYKDSYGNVEVEKNNLIQRYVNIRKILLRDSIDY